MTSPAPQQIPAPNFPVVARGYDRRQVDEHVGGLRGEIERLRHLLGDGASRALHAVESPRGEQAIVDLMRIAVDEIERNQAAAAADVAKMLEDARGEAAQTREEARKEATAMVAGARQQADTVLSTARAEGKRMTDKAAAESAAVSEGAARRLDGLRTLHAETLTRLGMIRDVTDRALTAESERGSMDDEFHRAMSGTAPQLTAGSERQ
jgi:cell division septum initiation protein DivIVA